ncbi:hypothetical protein NQT69_07520 [Pseudoalteromonas shioyasakiensis]|uniref:hypothetical protein n=1 Tax=Pseudoalteromonas shioyasakiensis TaxID=1190813 RepID=UPI00211848C4|nr:hypothetical protein [Pseudoalteromonas shioyasakiensis]MCQ8877845.1 hypothetical protein [Pseudoalteromonas shioyasakiensis]
MHYTLIAFIFSILFIVSPQGFASNDATLNSPIWLDVKTKLLLKDTQHTQFIEAKQSQYLWLPKGQWLDLDSNSFNSFILSAGTSHIAQQRLNLQRDFICQQARCQLPSQPYNRIVKVTNHLDTGESFDVMVGETLRHRDSFRRAVKMPRHVTRLNYGQDVENYYHFKAGEQVKLYFQHAKKLKITVRKDLLNKDINGKIYAYINEQPATIIGVLASRASEYRTQQIGLAKTDYIAIGKGEYLTLRSETDAYIKLEQSHRAIYDDLALDKQQEKYFQPYWIDNLDKKLKRIYLEQDLTALNASVYQSNDLLAQIRYQDLLRTVAKSHYLIPDSAHKTQFSSRFHHFDSLSGMRLVDDIGYPVLSEEYAQIHSLDKFPHQFSLNVKQRVKPTITFHARSPVDSQILVRSGNQQWQLTLLKSENFSTFELNIPLTASSLTIQNLQQKRHPIEYVMQSSQLLDLPNNELLYSRSGQLNEKSPVIASLLEQQLTLLGEEYTNNLVPYNPHVIGELAVSAQESIHWHNKLAEAHSLVNSDPLKSLQLLKQLVSVPNTALAIEAWQLRISLLAQQGRTVLAKSYLEGLYKSSTIPEIKEFAATKLLEQYTAFGQDYKLLGFCADAINLLETCQQVMIALAIKQQKNILALWLSHNLATEPTLENSYTRLNWRDYAEVDISQERYHLSHSGNTTLISANGLLNAYAMNSQQAITLRATSKPLTFAIRARSQNVQNGQYKMSWLFATKGQQQSILPIYSDISSTTALQSNGQLLSIASESLISLNPGESVRLYSDNPSFISIKLVTEALLEDFDYQDMASAHHWQMPFMNLLYDQSINEKTLLNNTLFKLSDGTLSINEYTQALAKLASVTLSAKLEALLSRVKSYGQWVPVNEYLDFAGTQLLTVDSLSEASLSDQLSRSSTQHDFKNGLMLRPLHSLNLDLSQTRSSQIRLNFHFSSAELSQGNIANIAIDLGNSSKTWSVEPGKITAFGFNKSELVNNVISLKWLNPYLSQIITLNAQEYRDGRWYDLPLPNKLLFYTVLPNEHLIAKLPADRLVKLEQMLKENGSNEYAQRIERTFFHPAGKVEVSTDKLKYVRLYTWQLSKTNHKISNYQAKPKLDVEKLTYTLPENNHVINDEVALFHPEDLSWQAFINYDRRGIFETSEDIPTRHSVDIGARFRLAEDENWYRLDLTYSLSEQDAEIFSIDGYHSWQDHDTPWYIDSAIQTSWQPGRDNASSQYGVNTYVQIGQIWRVDESHRHQWQVSPFYSYSSASLDDFLFDSHLNSDIYNFYREDHPHGWRGEYQYRYQPWVDSYFNFLAGSTTNSDWTSLDLLRFGASWNQYFRGHIFQAGLTSYYKFADDDRPNSTWQYITSLGWRKQIHLGDFSQGWIKLRWDQDWFRNDHNVSLEFSTGNLADTSFSVFSHDEIIFESLQLNHFLEQN